jgi:hypothetical protein
MILVRQAMDQGKIFVDHIYTEELTSTSLRNTMVITKEWRSMGLGKHWFENIISVR